MRATTVQSLLEIGYMFERGGSVDAVQGAGAAWASNAKP
jgi:hypothetical protein